MRFSRESRILILPPHLILITLLLFTRLSLADICCCPDLSAKLSCDEVQDSVKMDGTGFRCFVKKGADVTLQCLLHNSDHDAIKSIKYYFAKTNSLSNKPLTLDNYDADSLKKLCESDTASPSCSITDVKWTPSPKTPANLGPFANHIYQCMVEVTLEDDSVATLFSHTISFDVQSAPDPASWTTRAFERKTPANENKKWEKFECDLPESNPPAKFRWEFEKKNAVGFEEIDPTSDPRRERILMVDTEINADSSSDNVKRGMMILMYFTAAEDSGKYRCKGLYKDVFGATSEHEWVSDYEVEGNGQQDPSQASLKLVSLVQNEKYLRKDDSLELTLYARDGAPSSPIQYTWMYESDPSQSEYAEIPKDDPKFTDLSFPESLTTDPAAELSATNRFRTMKITNLYKHAEEKFKASVKRTDAVTVKEHPIQLKNKIVIVPEVMDIPVSPGQCFNDDFAEVILNPNAPYMMDSEEDSGPDPVQLLKNSQATSYYHELRVLNAFNIGSGQVNDKEIKFVPAKWTQNVDPTEGASGQKCFYIRAHRTYAGEYQLVNMMKVSRMATECADLTLEAGFCDSIKITCGDDISVTLPSGSPQCLFAEVLKNGEVKNKKYLSSTADSCTGSEVTREFTRGDLGEPVGALSGEFSVRIRPEGNTACPLRTVSCVTCDRPTTIPGDFNIASLVPDSPKIIGGAAYTVECKEGYVTENSELRCDGGQLTPSLSQCTLPEVKCELPSVSGTFSSPDPISVDEQVTLTCSADHIPASSLHTCNSDGNLDPAPKCEVVKNTPIEEVVGGLKEIVCCSFIN